MSEAAIFGPGHKAYVKRMCFKREGGECFWCEVPTPYKDGTVDHIVTKKAGGKLTVENCVYSCRPCNERRGAMTATSFLFASLTLPTFSVASSSLASLRSEQSPDQQ